jgi:glycosyltransferase involved in cell wall biosynthesis
VPRVSSGAAQHLGLVQWTGEVGGAEMVTLHLAAAMRRAGVEAEVVFVLSGGPITERLERAGIPFHVLGFRRGADVVWQPRRFARAIARHARGGVVLPECGFIGGALRAGGYRAPIVAVEHGALLNPPSAPFRRLLHAAARRWAAHADDAEVAVSDFTLATMRAHPHSPRLSRIHNGVDLSEFPIDCGSVTGSEPGALRVGFAGRLIPGKGADVLIRAAASLRERHPVRVAIAGDGPARAGLQALATELGLRETVDFPGMVADLRAFWAGCDVAAFPSDTFIDSFGMSALEAMACARPVVGTRCGGLPELVLDGATGVLVPPGDEQALAAALLRYAESPSLLAGHGAAARTRAREQFSIEASAMAYLELFAGLRAPRVR